jgi:hypothetical protein
MLTLLRLHRNTATLHAQLLHKLLMQQLHRVKVAEKVATVRIALAASAKFALSTKTLHE